MARALGAQRSANRRRTSSLAEKAQAPAQSPAHLSYVRAANAFSAKAYSTAGSPSGILNGLLQALEFNGVKRETIESQIDLDALEKQFAAIDADAFCGLVALQNCHPLQVAIIGTEGKTAARLEHARHGFAVRIVE